MINEEILLINSVANVQEYPQWFCRVVLWIFICVVVFCFIVVLGLCIYNIVKKSLESHNNENYARGYIKGANDRNNNVISPIYQGGRNFYKGYIDGHRDNEFWK